MKHAVSRFAVIAFAFLSPLALAQRDLPGRSGATVVRPDRCAFEVRHKDRAVARGETPPEVSNYIVSLGSAVVVKRNFQEAALFQAEPLLAAVNAYTSLGASGLCLASSLSCRIERSTVPADGDKRRLIYEVFVGNSSFAEVQQADHQDWRSTFLLATDVLSKLRAGGFCQ